MFGANKKKKAAEEAAAQEGGKKKKLTKKEKEKAERELRANLPTRGEVGRKGVFEMHGPLQYTFAVGQIPGGPFYPVDVIIKGHMLYLFEAGDGHRPSAKPRGFFLIKKAVLIEIGILQNPPLPPHSNVFRIEFEKKQMAHRAYFFKATSNKELQRWIADLSWRVDAGERQIRGKFEPDGKSGVGGGGPHAAVAKRSELQLQPSVAAASRIPHDMRRKLIDETEKGVELLPERVLGMVVRYDIKHVVEDDDNEDALDVEPEQKVKKQRAKAAANKDDERKARGTFKMTVRK